MGGYEVARRVHFLAMAGIVGFTAIHVLLVILVPRTLPVHDHGPCAGVIGVGGVAREPA